MSSMTDKRRQVTPEMGAKVTTLALSDRGFDRYLPVRTTPHEEGIEFLGPGEDSKMWEGNDPTTPTSNNRLNPKKPVKTILFCAALLTLAAILFGTIYAIMYFKPSDVDYKITSSFSTPSYTSTRSPFHRLQHSTSQPNLISNSEDDPAYKALIYTDHNQCTDIGRSFLVRGGNAHDAAIAALFCLSAVHPQNTGLGGGFLAILGLPTKCVFLDARETAPYGVTMETYMENPDEMGVGIKSVATPGFLAGIHTLYITSSGNFSLNDLISPTINLCDSGVEVDTSLASALQSHRDLILNDYVAKGMFINSTTNDVYKEGDRMYCSRYSQTLAEILELEIDHEYFDQKGLIIQIVGEMEEAGGYVTSQDMEDNNPRKIIGMNIPVGDFRLCGPGSPSSFSVAALALKASKISGYGLDVVFPLAIRELKRIGDHDVDASNYTIAEMMEDSFLAELVKKIQAGERAALETPDIPDSSTILVADEYGRTLSLTSSLGDTFGSRFLSRLGFFYNNAISSFKRTTTSVFNGTMDPEMVNVLQPGKAPRSLLAPVIGFYRNHFAFITSGADMKREVVTLMCLLDEEECKPTSDMLPSIRNTEDGFRPLIADPEKMSGF